MSGGRATCHQSLRGSGRLGTKGEDRDANSADPELMSVLHPSVFLYFCICVFVGGNFSVLSDCRWCVLS